MIPEKTHIGTLHQQHVNWKEELLFTRDELNFFEKRLEEIAAKNTDKNTSTKVEHFQNQFIIQREQIDTLLHHIEEHEKEIAQFAEDHPVAVDHHLFQSHSDMIEKMKTFHDLYQQLKAEFLHFVASAL
jgi:BMFP domain-containing protein YqiC